MRKVKLNGETPKKKRKNTEFDPDSWDISTQRKYRKNVEFDPDSWYPLYIQNHVYRVMYSIFTFFFRGFAI
jgi:hypothetical protein